MGERDENLTTADIAQPQEEAKDTAEETSTQEQTALLDEGDTESFRGRWDSIQASFVDEPRDAVQQADGLVAELMQRLAETFSQERESLESQWDSGDDVSTEDLRVSLTRYRSFFERLLST